MRAKTRRKPTKGQGQRGGRVRPEIARAREEQAWDLIQAGHTQAHIAEVLGVSRSAVSQMLDRIEARVLANLEARVTREKARQHGRLEHLYTEAMRGWLRSLEDAKTVTDELGGKDGPIHIEKLAGQSGDARLLLAALQALAEQRKLWGIDAPKKVDIQDQRRPLEKLTDEELRQRAAENAALLEADK